MLPTYQIYLNHLAGLLKPRFVTQSPHLLSSAEKDFEYCLRRFKGEGVRFLTVALPELRKAVDLSFKEGYLSTPKHFRTASGKAYPAFLSSHFEKVYNDRGNLLPTPNVLSIRHIRQVCEAFYKLQVPYSKATEASTLENFVNNEALVTERLNDWDSYAPDSYRQLLLTGASALTRRVFRGFDSRDIVPRHGPGKLATREEGEDKWNFTSWPQTLAQAYLSWAYVYPNPKMFEDLENEWLGLDRPEYGRSAVKLVPKDSRGPRIITMEPHSNMWIQQGLGRAMMSWLETRFPTKGHINFTDQTVNRWLAQTSSKTGEWATLDLKDASDLLSAYTVERIFRSKPRLQSALLAVRTPETVLPNGTVVPLKKYAGMGSATCFPVESYCFWAICVSAIAFELNISLLKASEFVYVFGDDIICPTELYDSVVAALHSVGLTVNNAKSYNKGQFRESCGMDAFNQIDVTPIRLKKLFPEVLGDGTAFAAWCAYANAFERRGYTSLADTIWQDLEKLEILDPKRPRLRKVVGKVPYGTSTSPYPCRIVQSLTLCPDGLYRMRDDPAEAERLNKVSKIRYDWSKDLQQLVWKVIFVVPKDEPSKLDGWFRLARNLNMGAGDNPSLFVLPRQTEVRFGWSAV